MLFYVGEGPPESMHKTNEPSTTMHYISLFIYLHKGTEGGQQKPPHESHQFPSGKQKTTTTKRNETKTNIHDKYKGI